MTKRHIVRAPQTDRYGFTVPTAFSDLEDDRALLALTATAEIPSPAPASANFPIAQTNFVGSAGTVVPLGTYVTTNRGFSLPGAGNLAVTAPKAGAYQLTLLASWRGNTDSGVMVGRLTTPYTVILRTSITGVVPLVVDGSILFNNKLGPMTRLNGAGVEETVTLAVNALLNLNAGDVLTPLAECPYDPGAALAGDVFAFISLTLAQL